MPKTFVLNWNPNRWTWPEKEYERDVRRTASGKLTPERTWTLGARKGGIEKGDLAIILRQGSDRGIVGVGRFTSEVHLGGHWDGSGRDRYCATVVLSRLVPAEEGVPVEVLVQRVPEVAWNSIQGAGVAVPEEVALRVLALCEARLGRAVFESPEEVSPTTRFLEGAVTEVTANRYERDLRARQACIDHWGTTCVACGFDFEAVYGPIGEGFIHVHHLRELSSIGTTYEVDPVADLRPLCPNCHAMIHKEAPAMSVAALKRLLRRAAAAKVPPSR